MSFASVLEDLIDTQNELNHLRSHRVTGRQASATAHRQPAAGSTSVENNNSAFPTAEKAENFYRSQLKLVRKFVEYYKQERQPIEATRPQLPKHVEAIELLDRALQPIGALPDGIDDACWYIVQGVHLSLSSLIRDGKLATTLEPRMLEHLLSSAQTIRDKATRLSDQLRNALRDPIDSRVTKEVRDDLENSAILIEAGLPKFESDCKCMQGMLAKLDVVRERWSAFQRLYQTLPLKLQRRMTIKDLSRLSLHEEQERFVSLDYDGCFQLGGVSGSGKTLILIYRALRLAAENPERSVFVLTINRSLATQLMGTLEVVGRGQPTTNLHVYSIYDLFQKCSTFGNDSGRFRLSDDRSGERTDQSWRDFVNHRGQTPAKNVFADPAVCNLRDSLKSRTGTEESAERYLREEVQGVQSAYLKRDRNQYLQDARVGRVLDLKESQRTAVLKIVDAWEEWLKTGSLCDVHTLSLEAAERLTSQSDRSQFETKNESELHFS